MISINSKGFLMENTNSDDFNMETLSKSKGTAEKENADINIRRKIKATFKTKTSKQKRTSVSAQKVSSSAPQRTLPFWLSKKRLLFGSAVIIFIILMGLVIHTSLCRGGLAGNLLAGREKADSDYARDSDPAKNKGRVFKNGCLSAGIRFLRQQGGCLDGSTGHA
jgi:hypothetical protein